MKQELTAFELLQTRAAQFGIPQIFAELMRQYPQFEWWSGSHGKNLHHYGHGGLIKHTSEIIEMGIQIIPTLHLESKVDLMEFYMAALFHDTGKMFDYEETSTGEWKPTQHRRIIHHLPRSAIIWHDVVSKCPSLASKYHDLVLHAILSHHGRREAGSPVAPLTRVAWLVHLCDGISARMNDADTLDIVKAP